MKIDILYHLGKYISLIMITMGLYMLDVNTNPVLDIAGIFLFIFGLLNLLDLVYHYNRVKEEREAREEEEPVCEDER